MRKKSLIFIVAAFVLLTSCAGTRGVINNAPDYIPIIKKDIKVMGTVRVEMNSTGVLGFTPEMSLISWGNNSSYVSLLDEAKKIGADDVLNIKIDNNSLAVLFFYNDRKWIASGLAVKYLDGVPAEK